MERNEHPLALLGGKEPNVTRTLKMFLLSDAAISLFRFMLWNYREHRDVCLGMFTTVLHIVLEILKSSLVGKYSVKYGTSTKGNIMQSLKVVFINNCNNRETCSSYNTQEQATNHT